MDANVNGVMPVIDMNHGYGDGWGGGNGCFMWVILLFALMGGGFGGWNNRVGDVATTRDVYASNDFQSLRSAVNNLGSGLADLGYALNTGILNGFSNTQRDIANGTYVIDKAITDNRYVIGNAVNENRFAAQNGFNGVERNIDAVRYENALNTTKVTETDTFNTQKILDKLCHMEMNAMKTENENLRMALADSRLAYSQQMQIGAIISQVRPFPIPAYQVGNPYGGCNCNCGVNYGCQ